MDLPAVRDFLRTVRPLARFADADLGPLAARLKERHLRAGHLLVTVYAKTRRENLRAELQAIAAEGGINARLASRTLS